MGRKRRTRKEKEVYTGNVKKIVDVTLAGDLMLKGYKLIDSYFSKSLNREVFCFDESIALNRMISRIRENRIINGYYNDKMFV